MTKEINILNHVGLIKKILRGYQIFDDNKLIQDYIGYGMLGLAKAKEKYNPAKGAFSTIAYHYVRREIQNGMLENDSAISYPNLDALRKSNKSLSLDYSYNGDDNYGSSKDKNVIDLMYFQEDKTAKTPFFETHEEERKSIINDMLDQIGPRKLLSLLFLTKRKIEKKEEFFELAKKYHPNIMEAKLKSLIAELQFKYKRAAKRILKNKKNMKTYKEIEYEIQQRE